MIFKVGDVVRPAKPITREMLAEMPEFNANENYDDVMQELNAGNLIVRRRWGSSNPELECIRVAKHWLYAKWFEVEVPSVL